MLEGGMDISLHPPGRNEHLAIVIGEKNDLDRALEKLECGMKIHMSQIQNKKTKEKIIKRLNFDTYNILSLSIKTERRLTVNSFKKNDDHYRNKRIWHSFDYELFKHLEPKLSKYLIPHKKTLSDIVFQCDRDTKGIARYKNLNQTKPRSAHTLADISAWAATHNYQIKGSIPLDFTREIHDVLAEKFKS